MTKTNDFYFIPAAALADPAVLNQKENKTLVAMTCVLLGNVLEILDRIWEDLDKEKASLYLRRTAILISRFEEDYKRLNSIFEKIEFTDEISDISNSMDWTFLAGHKNPLMKALADFNDGEFLLMGLDLDTITDDDDDIELLNWVLGLSILIHEVHQPEAVAA